ncbi:MAG: RHS repeat-associated core domain-containing protein [Phycisphaeraceae bacterium]|nr:RHS repeat-associated core domain-containing protein [Phycisphaeraceae bacterium]
MANRAGEGTCAGTLSSRVPQGQYSGGSGYVDNRFGWAGYLWDPALEVYHVRHRVYDPADGRWLQPDPIGHAGGWNLYEYGGGDYANTIDPWGLEAAIINPNNPLGQLPGMGALPGSNGCGSSVGLVYGIGSGTSPVAGSNSDCAKYTEIVQRIRAAMGRLCGPSATIAHSTAGAVANLGSYNSPMGSTAGTATAFVAGTAGAATELGIIKPSADRWAGAERTRHEVTESMRRRGFRNPGRFGARAAARMGSELHLERVIVGKMLAGSLGMVGIAMDTADLIGAIEAGDTNAARGAGASLAAGVSLTSILMYGAEVGARLNLASIGVSLLAPILKAGVEYIHDRWLDSEVRADNAAGRRNECEHLARQLRAYIDKQRAACARGSP